MRRPIKPEVQDKTPVPQAAAWLKNPAAFFCQRTYAERLEAEPRIPKEADDADADN
jgi:hypothetical protein